MAKKKRVQRTRRTPANVIAYHANCTDGFASAVTAWEKFKDKNTTYIAVDHGQKPPKAFSGSNAYVLDFSYPTAELAAAAKKSPKMVVIDHMVSNQAWLMEQSGGTWVRHFSLPQHVHVIFDPDATGALLSWQYFHGSEPPYFLHILLDYEKREFKLPETKAVMHALRSRPYDFQTWHQYLKPGGYLSLCNEGAAIARFLSFQAELVIQQNSYKARLSPALGGKEAIVVNAPLHLVGEIADLLTPQVEIVVIYQLLPPVKGEVQVRVCLRSHKDTGPDVSGIAHSYGNGGHEHAAGFDCSWSTFLSLFA